MSRRLNLAAVITVGGAVASSLGSAMGTARTRIGTVGTAIEQVERRQRELRQEIGRFAASGRAVGGLNQEYARLEVNLNRLRRSQAELNRLQDAGRRNDQAIGETRGQLGTALAMGAAFAAPVVVAARFEQQMARVGAISRATDEDLGRLTRQARDLGASTEWSASQAAEGMQFLAMAGFTVDETMAAMPGMLSLATAGQIELGEASAITSSTLRAFGLEAGEATRVGDVLTNTFTTSNTDLRGLGDTMRYVAPVAAQVGVSIEETAAAIGLLGNAGIQGSQAGTTLRTMMSRLAAPMRRGEESLTALGVATKTAAGDLRPMEDILSDLNRAMAGMGTATRAEHMKNIFGLEALSGAMVLVEQAGAGALGRYTETVGKAGTAAEVAARQADTSVGSWLEFTGALEETGITVGDALTPALRTLGGVLTEGIRWVGQLADRYPRLTQAVVVLTASVIGLRVAYLGSRLAWLMVNGSLLRVATSAATATAANAAAAASATGAAGASAAASGVMSLAVGRVATAFRAAGAAVMTNPIFLAVGLLAGAAYLIYRNWEPITEFFGMVWRGVGNVVEGAIDFIGDKLGWTPLGAIINHWEPIRTFFTDLWSGIMRIVGGAVDWIASKIEWVGNAVAWVRGQGEAAESRRTVLDANGNVVAGPDATRAERRAARAEAAPDDAFDFGAIAPAGQTSVSRTDARTINLGGVTIHAAPGQDENALAERVAARVRELLEAGDSGALYDGAAA